MLFTKNRIFSVFEFQRSRRWVKYSWLLATDYWLLTTI